MFLRNSKPSPASGISHISSRLLTFLEVTASASEQFEAPKNYCASVEKTTPTLAIHFPYYATHFATTHWSLKQNASSAARRTLHFKSLSKFFNLVRLFETFKTISTTSVWLKKVSRQDGETPYWPHNQSDSPSTNRKRSRKNRFYKKINRKFPIIHCQYHRKRL